MAPTGLFPEGGTLDRLDKCLSRPFFRLSLPWPIEVGLTMPGSWFGCPLYSLGFVPVALGALLQDSKRTIHASVPITLASSGLAGIGFVGVGYWCKLCRDSLQTGKGITTAYTLLSHKWLLLMPNMIMFALSKLGNEAGARVAAHYMSGWFCSQLVIEVCKGLAWRLRPAIVMKDELADVPRAITELTMVVSQPSQANLSFPSGDAAGGAVFAAALYTAAPQLQGQAIAIAGICALGRMYFHCHHLLDVVVGQCIGAGATILLSRCTKPSWGVMVIAQLFMFGLWKPVQKLKPKDGAKQELEPKALDRK